jgi:hypothetical protein
LSSLPWPGVIYLHAFTAWGQPHPLQGQHHPRHLPVDRGATLSLVLHCSLLQPTDLVIGNANGGITPSWNFISKSLFFGKHKFKHNFFQSNVSQSILGADVLKAHNAKIDFQTGRVHFPSSLCTILPTI